MTNEIKKRASEKPLRNYPRFTPILAIVNGECLFPLRAIRQAAAKAEAKAESVAKRKATIAKKKAAKES